MRDVFISHSHENRIVAPAIKHPAAARSVVVIAGLLLLIAGGLSLVSSSAAEVEATVVLPSGVYRAIRGYGGQRSGCPGQIEIPMVAIHNGSIAFENVKHAWEGTVDQATGNIDIPSRRITQLNNGLENKFGLSVNGHYRNATLFSHPCGQGYFRILNGPR